MYRVPAEDKKRREKLQRLETLLSINVGGRDSMNDRLVQSQGSGAKR
jgi:hypothetical protein